MAMKRKLEAIVDTLIKQNKKQKQAVVEPEPIVLLDSDSEDESNGSSTSTENEGYDRIGVSKKDHDLLLKKKTWLNDSTIDFYMKHLKEKYDLKDEVYVFNSLFFMKLQKIQKSSAKTKDYYNEAKSWLNKDAINKKSIWLIPVCEGKHWYTIVISKPVSSRPLMYVFDSLYKRRKAAYSAIDLIKNFVYQKYKAENTGKFRRFKCVKIKNPQQVNNDDCGLFALRSAEIVLALNHTLIKSLLKDKDYIDENHEIYREFPVPTRNEVYNAIQNKLQNLRM